MENALKARLQSIHLAEPQIYKNIAIVPLVAPADGTFQYCTLNEALGAANVAITEVSASGSVPELMVFNRGTKPVLLIDGEELAGARQNRVLNTSILVKEASETTIPVSCTEQGRWAYTSKVFSESGNVMAYKSRSRKTRSVHCSLEASAGHKSDQGEVWHGIAELQAHPGLAPSPTAAMSDVYKAREEDLRVCDQIFKPVANQIGLLAFIGGAPAGADMVSLTGAYAKVHPKLVRSYALEALIESPQPSFPELWPSSASSPTQPPPSPHASELLTVGHSFLLQIAAADERQFPSVGYGTDFRYRHVVSMSRESESATPHSAPRTSHSIVGSALVHENEVIHAAFFRLEDSDQPAPMASYRSRFRRFTQ